MLFGSGPEGVDPANSMEVESALQELETKGIWTDEIVLDHGSYSRRVVQAEWRCERKPDGGRVLFEIYRDVTDLRENERMLLRNQRMENLGALAGGIAHDLNNILAPIGLSAEMLQRDTSRERTDYFAGMILQAVRRVLDRPVGD